MARKALGPAMLSVFQAVRAAWCGEDIVVACSGGSDSTALAFAAILLGERRGAGVRGVVVDHGLQEGSAQWSTQVATRLIRAGLPTDVIAVEVLRAGTGLEAAARSARYAALSRVRRPGERIYLGHTLDDQAETVLLGLARGSGTRSLAGMRPVRDGFVRPLLGLRSHATTAACQELGVSWVEDPHNAEDRFTRARIRRRALPMLEAELGPGVAEALARTAELAREDADALDLLAATELPDPDVEALECAAVGRLLPAIRARVLRRWLSAHGAHDVTKAHVDAVVSTLIDHWHGQSGVNLPGLRVMRRQGSLVVGDR